MLIPYINIVCLHKPVCIKLSHMADSSLTSDGHLIIPKKRINVNTNRTQTNNDSKNRSSAMEWPGLNAVRM